MCHFHLPIFPTWSSHILINRPVFMQLPAKALELDI